MYGTLISTQTLASTTASVTFSSIPATYTDLVLVVSSRSDYANVSDVMGIRFNGDSAGNYNQTFMWGQGSSVSLQKNVSTSSMAAYYTVAGGSSTASTFGNTIITIPNYASSTTKVAAIDGVGENNTASAYQVITGANWTGTSAINNIVCSISWGTGFVSGSTFSLYGLTHF